MRIEQIDVKIDKKQIVQLVNINSCTKTILQNVIAITFHEYNNKVNIYVDDKRERVKK